MLLREIITVCRENHTGHTNGVWGEMAQLLGRAHIETQAAQGRAAQVSVIHTFEYVSASWEGGQGSTVLRLFFACATQCSGHNFATQPTQGRAAQVSMICTFEYVSASWEVEQGSTVLRLLLPAPRSVPDTILQRSPRRAEQRRFLWFTRFNMSARVEREGRAAQFCVCFCLRHIHLNLITRSIVLSTYRYAFIILR